MTRENFIRNYNIDPAALPMQHVVNSGLGFDYAELGPYTVYRDDAWGYYVAHNNSTLRCVVDLSKYVS